MRWSGVSCDIVASERSLLSREETRRSLRCVRLGALASSRAFARDREARGAASLRGPRRSTIANAAGLTRREQEVLSVLARGATGTENAAALHLSERTVAHHVSAILGKLSVSTRTAAVEAARGAGLLGGKDGQGTRAT